MGSASLAEGEILAGKYRVLSVLGEGGMGEVYAAEHVQLGHRVALKVMRSSALASDEAVERFLREGRAAARLQSEHIARVSDVGTLESGLPYMVMELLEGKDLAQILAAEKQLPIEQAVEFIIQASEAIAEAHRNGIVHRDLKPANLFVTATLDGAPLVKVLDFGISKSSAKLLGSEAAQITSTAAMIGSPKYMSPEQMQDSRTVDERADIWALGVILYEALAGRRAFDAATLATTCVQILQEDPPPVRQSRPEVPEALDDVVMRCLKKDPDERYASIAEFVQALEPFARDSQALVARIVRMTTARPIRELLTPRRIAAVGVDAASSVAAVAAGLPRKSIPDDSGRSFEGRLAGSRRRGTIAIAGVAALVGVLALIGLRGGRPVPSTVPAAGVAPSPEPIAPPAASTAEPHVAPPPAAADQPAPAAAIDAGVLPAAISSAPSAPARSAAPPPRRAQPRPRPSTNPPGVTDSVLEDRR